MADFREESQDYARGAIKAAILLNGAAAVALLSQASDLLKADLGQAISSAMLAWAIGTFVGATCWIFAFVSTRYVDKSEREQSTRHLLTSDRFMLAGIVAVVLSLLCFLVGCLLLSRSLVL